MSKPVPLPTGRQLRDLERSIEQKDIHLKNLADISVRMNACRTPHELFDLVCGRTRELLGAMRVALMVWNPNGDALWLGGSRGFAGTPTVDLDTLVEPGGAARRAWDTQRVIQFTETTVPTGNTGSEENPNESPAVRSVLAIPFSDTEAASGVIYVEDDTTEEASGWTEDKRNLLTLIASQTASTLRNLKLFADLEDQIKNLHAAQEIGNLLVSTFDLDTVLRLIVRGIRDVTRAEVCSIMLFEETGEFLVIRASEGIPEEVIREAKVRRGENIAGWVAEHGQPLLIRDLDEDPRFVPKAGSRYPNNSLLSVPLKAKGQVLGVININHHTDGRVFTPEDQNLMMLFASQAAIALENARLYKELERLAITDGLTGLANHRAFQERLIRELSRAQRFMQEVSLVILDIDFFKVINDRYGHLTGDHVLRCISQNLTNTLRKMDFVARYGGEEFAIIMPQTKRDEAVRISERLRHTFEEQRFIEEAPEHVVTVSIGLAEYPSDAAEALDLIDQADQALYSSKNNGRNRVTLAGDL